MHSSIQERNKVRKRKAKNEITNKNRQHGKAKARDIENYKKGNKFRRRKANVERDVKEREEKEPENREQTERENNSEKDLKRAE